MSEPIKFRSEGERADWTLAFRESDYSDPVAAGLDADDFLAERRKREGAHESPALSPVNGYAVAMDVMETLVNGVSVLVDDGPSGCMPTGLHRNDFPGLAEAEALVAAARGTK